MNLDWLLGPSCKGCGARPKVRTIGMDHKPGCVYFAELDRRTRKALGRIP